MDNQKELQGNILGHPKGLFVLFFYQIFEAYSFYGMKFILVYFLIDKVNGGLGWPETKALTLVGWYGGLCYLLSPLGGICADKYISKQKAVILGSILMCIGHFLFIFNQMVLFFSALILLIAGSNLYKSSTTALISELYPKGDPRFNNGVTIHYLGNNIGSFFASIVSGLIGKWYGWHYAFTLAGFGMLTGLIIFLWGKKYLTNELDIHKTTHSMEDAGLHTEKTFQFSKLSVQEKDRFLVLFLVLILVVVFIGLYDQLEGFIPIYVENYINKFVMGKEIPAAVFNFLNPLFIIIFGGLLNLFWNALSRRYTFFASSIMRICFGYLMITVAFVFMIFSALEKRYLFPEVASLYWLILVNFFIVLAELSIVPVSLAFVSRLVPKSIKTTAIGTVNLTLGLGALLAANIGKLTIRLGDLVVFERICLVGGSIVLMILVFKKRIVYLTHGCEDVIEQD